MTKRQRSSGFTLVELMVVVAIVCVIGAVAARLYSGGIRGETAPAFARSMLAALADARHQAVALGKQTRMSLVVDSDGGEHIDTEAREPTTGTWVMQGSLKVPRSLQLCQPSNAPQIGNSVTPTCPITTSSSNNWLCFNTNGRINVRSDSGCLTTDAMTGATWYLQTVKADKKYRIVIWGLTGMAKVIDTW